MTESPRWRAIEEQFHVTGDAAATQSALTHLRDEAVGEAYRAAIQPAFPNGVALLACGAYGRGLTFPYSELDLVLVADSPKRSAALKEKLPEFVRLLWNAGLRPTLAAHTVAECLEVVEGASAPAFALLDLRAIEGDRSLIAQCEAKLSAAMAQHREKLRQRLCQSIRARHSAQGNTPNHAEPDVKESPGGLLDARAIEWLARLKGETAEPAAVACLSAVRCGLHFRARADRNTLDFEAQTALAQQAFGFSMRRYFECAHAIFNETRRAVDDAEKIENALLSSFREFRARLSNQEFTVSRERLILRNPAQVATDPAIVLRMLEFIARHGVPPSPDTERRLESAREALTVWLAQPRSLWSSLRSVLAAPHAELALRALQSTGLMRALLPEWDAIDGRVTAGAESRYTADEQTLRAIEVLNRPAAEHQRFAGLLGEVDDVALLVFALLFQELGSDAVENARRAAIRVEMPADARDLLEFQVAHRTELADTIASRDVDDPATVRLLAERVGTAERLRLLAAATYARTVALGPAGKLPWRLDRLWRLYTATQRELLRELETERIRQVPENFAHAEFVRGFPLRYLHAHSPEEIQEHIGLFERSRPTGVAVKLDPLEGAYRITIVARDKPALFASFAGAISSFGLDILKAEAFCNAAGVILDTFVVADPRRMLQLNPTESDRLGDLLQRVALGRTKADKFMRGNAVADTGRRMPARVQFDSEACATATLVEIDAEDRPGLLYSLASVFSSSACNIDVVLVDTKGHRAIDVFYVAHEGRKLPPEMQERLREKLLAVC